MADTTKRGSSRTAPALDAVHIEEVLEHVNVPSYHIDPTGIVRWLNAAARNIVGDVRGSQFTSVVAPEETRRARELFARKVIGATTSSTSSGRWAHTHGSRRSRSRTKPPETTLVQPVASWLEATQRRRAPSGAVAKCLR